ncbi:MULTISPECIES: histidine phosphatase family protein [Prauserella salsuginis group]|uniref:Histidine phosphatase family protein n=1 Tax=Prauserella salsuginis TaxID=387889 RepID=A0ABW6FZS9_9PSEU|nr:MULTISPECIES: histidine phosphatase family protein [Prauserella salsuginis group]MCR3720240.1 putative phosphoglycerate mutase [Prauserella flava]MCR3734051.1 putative phosphoglycerate mutase [Prauserella salsuginis]
MRLYLVRHAQSEANVRKILDTALPGPPLTELGRQQARDLAERLGGEPIAAVYASYATRARQTAGPLADALSMEVTLLPGVQEVSVGDLEGRGDQEALELYGKIVGQWLDGRLDVPLPGGETGHDVRKRYVEAIDGLRDRHYGSGEAVVVVSHGGAIRFGAEWLAGNVTSEIADNGLLPNTAVVRLDADANGGWHCSEWAGISVGN